jgi:cobyrinic acid a,c-diamide synthase
MHLGEELVLEEELSHGRVLPLSFGLFKRPQGHGYTVVTVERENPTTRSAPRSAATSSTTRGC